MINIFTLTSSCHPDRVCHPERSEGSPLSALRSLAKLGMTILLLIVTCLNCRAEQIFKRGNFDEPDTLDPQQALAVSDTNILYDLYEGLMTYDNQGRLVLGQAERYKISADHKNYTFKLRHNLQWSNGKKLTAFDFERSIRRAVDPKIGSTNYFLLDAIKNSKEIYSGKLPVNKLGVKALDDETLIVQLDRPTPYILDLLSSPTFVPVYINQDGKVNSYITNGPFKLKEWVVNSHISIVRNEKYINADQVKLDKVVFYPINQQSVELKRYRAGDLDYTNKVLFTEFDWVRKNIPLELYSKPMLASYYYSFNVTKPPFDNKYLRKAFALAIDKNIIARKILGGDRSGTDHFVPKGISNYKSLADPAAMSEQQRLKLARDNFRLAGYDPNSRKALKVKLFFHTNEANRIIAAAIASMWKKTLGVEVELINQEWKVFLRTRLDHSTTQVIREGWIAQYDDPLTFLSLFVSDNVQNASGFNNQMYDNLIKKAENTKDINDRTKVLNQAEQILLDENPVVPIYTPEVYHLVKPYIKGFNVDNRDRTFDKFISVSKTV